MAFDFFKRKTKSNDIEEQSAPVEPAAEIHPGSELQPGPKTQAELNRPVKEKKPPKRTRNVSVNLRLTAEEAAELTELAKQSGKTKVDFILDAARGVPIVRIDAGAQLMTELRRQGQNLNQAVLLAHRSHATNITELNDALKENAKLRGELAQFIDHWNAKIVSSKEGATNANRKNQGK